MPVGELSGAGRAPMRDMSNPQEQQPFDPKTFVRNLTERPGVYRMLDGAGEVLYVGKARNLKRRVGSYFTRQFDSAKTAALVAQIQGIEITVTHTEARSEERRVGNAG